MVGFETRLSPGGMLVAGEGEGRRTGYDCVRYGCFGKLDGLVSELDGWVGGRDGGFNGRGGGGAGAGRDGFIDGRFTGRGGSILERDTCNKKRTNQ